MKRVGYSDDIWDEIEIKALKNCLDSEDYMQRTDGWVPHFVFDDISNNEQKIQIARVDESWFGVSKDIVW